MTDNPLAGDDDTKTPLAPHGENEEQKSNDQNSVNIEPKKEIRKGICAPWKWFKENPIKRWQFAVFLLFGALTIVWLIVKLVSGIAGDIMAGIMGIILGCYAANSFRILLGLKVEIEIFSKNNKAFKSQNVKIKKEVNKLKKAQIELEGVSKSLKKTTTGYSDNIKKFQELDDKLSKYSSDNIKGLEKLTEISKTVQDSIQKELIHHERAILHKVEEAMEFGDDKAGLDENEYNKFIKALPLSFQRRFSEMDKTFKDIAGSDGVLDFNEFTQLADQFAVAEAKAGGSTNDLKK